MRRSTAMPLLAAWFCTRLPLALFVLDRIHYPWRWSLTGDLAHYRHWAEVFSQGHFPVGDHYWQYPPASAWVLLAPQWLPGDYTTGFLTLAVLADAAILILLLGVVRRGGSWRGPAAWVAAGPMLGPICYARYDVIVTAVVVAAVVATARPAVSGALAGTGAAVKVWPALLVFGCTRRTLGRFAAGGLAAGVMLLVGTATLFPGALEFLRNQRDRGVQLESVPGMVFLVGRHFGWTGSTAARYGSREFIGPHVAAVATVALVFTLAGMGALLLWRRRAPRAPAPHDVLLCATLLTVVTSRVLSPQYLVWLIALAAVCLAHRASGQRAVAALVLVCAPLTQVEFPMLVHDLVTGDLPGEAVLLARNVTLLVATGLSVWALRTSSRTETRAPMTAPRRPVAATRIGG